MQEPTGRPDQKNKDVLKTQKRRYTQNKDREKQARIDSKQYAQERGGQDHSRRDGVKRKPMRQR